MLLPSFSQSSQILTGSIFNSTGFEMWTWWTLICDDNVDCTVNCLEDHGCNRITVIGPQNSKLSLNCLNHPMSCWCCITINVTKSTGFHVNGYNADIQEIYPSNYTFSPSTTEAPTGTMSNNTEWSYYDYNQPSVPFICPDDIECILNCYGSLSCWTAIIYGPKNAELTINCDSSKDIDYPNSMYSLNRACSDMTIHAEDSSKLTINVYNQPEEFKNNMIYSPYNPQTATPEINTFITCGFVSNTTFSGSITNVCGDRNHIYSVYGWQTVLWSFANTTGSDSSIYWHNITMHCGYQLEESCKSEVEQNYYKCQSDQCYGVPPTHSPSNSQVPSPTQAPTTTEPSQAPTGTMNNTEWSYYDYNQPSVPFICPDDIECVLNCYGSLSCWTAIIYGPKNAELTINCDSSRDIDYPNSMYSQSEACSDMTIYAEDSSKLTINVYNQPEEFKNNMIYSPYNSQTATSDINTLITCGFVTNTTFSGSITNVCGDRNHIYSVYGWQTVLWSFANTTGSELSIYWHNITMHCGYQFEESCKSEVEQNYYKCQSDQCYGVPPTSYSPSYFPTSLPTQKPSTETTVAPTRIPSDTPSAFPSLSPTTITTNPTIMPTQITDEPTINPTINPTEDRICPQHCTRYHPDGCRVCDCNNGKFSSCQNTGKQCDSSGAYCVNCNEQKVDCPNGDSVGRNANKNCQFYECTSDSGNSADTYAMKSCLGAILIGMVVFS